MKCLIEFLLLLTEGGREAGRKENRIKFISPQTKKEKWRRRKPVQEAGRKGKKRVCLS